MCLDIQRAAVDEDGVTGLHWPISRDEYLRVLDAVASALVGAAHRPSTGTPGAKSILAVLVNHVVLDVMAVYQAQALIGRFGARGERVLPPPGSRTVIAALQGRPPAPPPVLAALREGPPASRWWRAPARVARDLLIRDGVRRRPLFGLDPRRDIVTISVDPLVLRHARAIDEPVTFRRIQSLLPRTAEARAAPGPMPAASQAGEAAAEALAAGFRAGGAEPPRYLADYVRDWVGAAGALVDGYLGGLLRHPAPVPRRLWTGSGGSPWVRILRQAVRELGGEVTGHDHATGEGHLRSSLNKTLVELVACDRFMTFTKAQAEGLGRGARSDLLFDGAAPDIVSLPAAERDPPGRARPIAEAEGPAGREVRPVRRVMYVSTIYFGERVDYTPGLPDLVALDWQARLFAWLRRQGLAVLHKPHPESRVPPPPVFAERFGVATLTGPFERVMGEADVLLFDYPLTTTFGAALAGDRPVVLVDFAVADFDPGARELLERRCRIVRGWFDADNRARVDWHELGRAIDEAQGLRDPAFCDAYLGMGATARTRDPRNWLAGTRPPPGGRT